MGQPQSLLQMVALFLLLIAGMLVYIRFSLLFIFKALVYTNIYVAILLNFGPVNAGKAAADLAGYNFGLLAVGTASLLSGLSTALTQRTLTSAKPRPSIFLSAEMAVYGIVFLVLNLIFNNDIKGGGYNLFQQWEWSVLIPVISNV